MNEDHIEECDDVENPIRPSEHEESSSGSQEEENRQENKTVRISENVEVIKIEKEKGSIENDKNELNPNDQNEQQFQQPNEMPVPPVPTKEEWTEHQITHVPFKPWCEICVRNAAMNNPHKMKHYSRTTAMFCMDYMYMTKKPSEEDLMHPILVIKERMFGGVWSLPVLRKGTYMNNVVQRVVNIITSIGSPKVVLKSDQEPAMIDIQSQVRKEFWNEMLIWVTIGGVTRCLNTHT